MPKRISNCGRTRWAMMAFTIVTAINGTSPAQVIIDMPSPPRTVSVDEAAAHVASVSVAGPTVSFGRMRPDVGDIAFRRYARARTTPFDTYSNLPQFAGIRMFSVWSPFPVFWWGGFGPWWGWGPCGF